MISETIEKALNDHINKEFYSAYLYLSMSAYCDGQGLPGFGHWLEMQFREETNHGMKFLHFLEDRGGRVQLEAIQRPPTDFGSVRAVFEQALQHEQNLSEDIHRLYDLAVQENDHACQPLLHWFIAEQTEEEKTARQILEQLTMIGDDGAALLVLDRELAARQVDADQ